MEKQKQTFANYFKERGKNVFLDVLLGLYALFCTGAIIYFAVLGGEHFRDCLIGLSYLAVVPVFYLAEYILKIRASLVYIIFILVYCVFCFLGASFNFYTTIPCLDDILHMCWGLLFTSLGFCVIKAFLGEPKTWGQFFAYLIFSAGFCMIAAIVWEIYEFTMDNIFPNFDMQEDVIVNSVHSFMLHEPYDHMHTLRIDGIAYTQLYDADGNLLYTIQGGYLDTGRIDTMMDLIWCFILTAVFCGCLTLDKKLGGKLYPYLIPAYVGDKGKQPQTAETAEQPLPDDTKNA